MLVDVFDADAGDQFANFKDVVLRMNVIVQGEPFDFAAAWEQAKVALTAIRSPVPIAFSRERITENIESITIKSENRGAMRMALEDGMFFRFAWCLQALLGEMGCVVHWNAVMAPVLYSDMELNAKKRTSVAS